MIRESGAFVSLEFGVEESCRSPPGREVLCKMCDCCEGVCEQLWLESVALSWRELFALVLVFIFMFLRWGDSRYVCVSFLNVNVRDM